MADETRVVDTATGELIGRMKARIKSLSRDLAGARAAATEATGKAAQAAKDYDANPLKAENERLHAELRGDRHKAAFTRLATAAGARGKAAEHLYQLSGWKADKDDVDEIGMTAAIAKLRESADYAFEAPADPEEPDKTQSRPPPAHDRGPQHKLENGGIVLTAAMRADPKFMLSKANAPLILDAAKNHRLKD